MCVSARACPSLCVRVHLHSQMSASIHLSYLHNIWAFTVSQKHLFLVKWCLCFLLHSPLCFLIGLYHHVSELPISTSVHAVSMKRVAFSVLWVNPPFLFCFLNKCLFKGGSFIFNLAKTARWSKKRTKKNHSNLVWGLNHRNSVFEMKSCLLCLMTHLTAWSIFWQQCKAFC